MLTLRFTANKEAKILDSKLELKWLAVYIAGSTLAVGLMTDFRFRPIEIQLHDTYYVFDAFRTIQYCAGACFMIRGIFLLIDLLTTRYRILALFVSIINPLVALFLLIIAAFGVQSFADLREDYPAASMLKILVPLAFLGTVVMLQVLLEVRMIRKLKELLNDGQNIL